MEYLKIEGEFPKLANCAVTMGKFDGIHRGHRKLVEKIRERKTLGEQAVLFAIHASSNMILTSHIDDLGLHTHTRHLDTCLTLRQCPVLLPSDHCHP